MFFLWMALACTDPNPATGDDTDETEETDDGGTDTPADTDETDLPQETDETDHTDETDPPPPAPSCELGTGELTFEPLVDGQDLMQVRGPQGLWHAYGSVRCQGIVPGHDLNPLDPTNPIITWKLDDCGKLIAGYEELPRPMNRDGVAALTGELLVFRTRTYRETLGRTLQLIFHLEDDNGVVIDIQREVRVVGEPGDTDFPVDTGGPEDTGCAPAE